MKAILVQKARTGLHYFDVKQRCDYFDSYGQPPEKAIQEFMEKHANSIEFNTGVSEYRIRCLRTILYIYFLLKRAMKHRMHKIISVFNENRDNENDVYILDFIHNKFNC